MSIIGCNIDIVDFDYPFSTDGNILLAYGGEFDNDGYRDLIVLTNDYEGTEFNSPGILHTKLQDTAYQSTTLPIDDFNFNEILVVDEDSSGYNTIYYHQRQSSRSSNAWHRITTKGDSVTRETLKYPDRSFSLSPSALVDFDQDGDVELLGSHNGVSFTLLSISEELDATSNEVKFDHIFFDDSGDSYASVRVLDYDGDKDPDIVTLRRNGDDNSIFYVEWYENQIGESVVSSNDAYFESAIKVEIFPNPTTDFLNIRFPDSETTLQKHQLLLVDQTGRILFTRAMVGATQEVSIGHLPQGQYFLVGVNEKGSIGFVREVVRQ